MTREEAEKLRDHKRNNAPKSTRSISLEEFDEMRRVRSDAVRETIAQLQLAHTIVEEGRPTFTVYFNIIKNQYTDVVHA